ncbi:hypothetical protein [Chryseobacterium sp. SIMBA_029]|uniref:hypothetical protein n=1 Tax=Chryseobacterium sp. SIMBA_029 TaxID=3085772 RepID=UPI00397D0391
MIKNPIYTAELMASGCSVEVSVNGIATFISSEEGTVSVDWDLNLLILKKGVQNLTLMVKPLKGETLIRKKAIVRIQIVIREGVEEYVPQEVITDKVEISFLEKKDLSVFIHTNTFSAEGSPAIKGLRIMKK